MPPRVRSIRLRPISVISAAILILAFSAGGATTTLRAPLMAPSVRFDQLPGWTPLAPTMRDGDVLLMAYTVDPEVDIFSPVRYGITPERRLVTVPDSMVAGLQPSEQPSAGPRFTVRPITPAGTDLVAAEGDGTNCVISRWAGTSSIASIAVSEDGARILMNECLPG